uniref:uroporphyrinogen-III C-methyltransferase n=1 Tax=uncultured bacterium 5G4 TaxID=1701326 RepID=A0A166H3R2_9BACT|nr:putative tetrapyrrole (corrin/porphyrin) methylase [uncultured bacterium 5G4]
MSGFVSLVGAGPGDPGLITVAGRDRIQRAEVIVYDRLIAPSLLDYAPSACERIFAGKSPEHKALSQTEINDLLVERGLRGQTVVRLKGGDPFVFGRGGEEALALVAAGVPFEVIPGVTSAVAAPAYAGVPVTHRGLASSFAVVTGHEDDEKPDTSVDWSRLATAVDTIVVLMGGAALARVSQALIVSGRDPETPAVSIEWGTTTGQRSVSAPLVEIAHSVREAGLRTPLLTVIGPSASLRDQLSWFEGRPLFGKRILVTRSRHQASALADLLRREGATPIEMPTIELAAVASDTQLEAMAQRLEARDYAWCLLTSTNAVEWLFAYLERTGRDARAFAGCRIGVLGTATGETLRRYGLRADLTATEFSSDGLRQAMPEDLHGARILLPRGEGGNPTLVTGLQSRGATVDEVTLYDSRPPAQPDEEALSLLRDRRIDLATFASSSSVRNLKALLGDDFSLLQDVTIACIGPMTAATARELGLAVSVEPPVHTIPALVDALKTYLTSQP